MEQKLPYEQQLSEQWINLPQPNEDICWADMKKRLEEDDDERPIIFWWRRGCGLWGLLLIAMVSIGWWAYRFYSNNHIAPVGGQSAQQTTKYKTGSGEPGEREIDTAYKKNATIQKEPEQALKSGTNPSESERKETIQSPQKNTQQPAVATALVEQGRTGKNEIHLRQKNNKQRIKGSNNDTNRQVAKAGIAADRKRDKETITRTNSKMDASNKTEDSNVDVQGLDSMKSKTIDSIVKPLKDTVRKKISDMKKDTLNSAKNPLKTDSAKKSSYFFSGGLSIHQQIPTAGQSFTPYNSLGRKGSLADYIPAPYIRFTKKDKWFVQAEFRYGAPVYGKSFIYDQNQTVDTFNNQVITNSLRLKKTFYHQVPVSFHFNVKKGFTIGTGLVWNKFRGAIAEQELISRNRTTGIETVLSKAIIKDSSAQSFSKSFFQAHVETQYQWKRLHFGARYNFGLQPFIKFSLPGLAEQTRRSNNLQVFFRYQLWRSKK